MAKFGVSGGLALAGVGAAGLAMGVKVASGNEQARISFTTMLGSAQKADKFLRQLQKFAAETPFEFPELQTAASSLISAGINASKVIPIMRTLGDVTSGMGTGSEGVRRATIALQQMNAAGKITAEDLNQLRDAGIPVYDLLSKATGKSKAEVVKLAQAGKLGHKELDQMMKALESGKGLERFNGLMEKQSKSLAGMASTLKDTLGQGLANAVAPTFPLIKQGLESVSKTASTFFGWINKNKGAISETLTVTGSILKSLGAVVSATFGGFVKSFGNGQAAFKSFADFLETHQADITGGLVMGGKAALGLGKAVATGVSIGLRAFGMFSDQQARMVSLMLDGFGLITHGAAAAFGWIPGIGEKLKLADANFAPFAAHAKEAMKRTGDGARAAADAIDKHVIPAIDSAQKSLDKVGNTEIAKAKLRDTASKAAQAIRAIGTESDGSQIKLKHFNDRTKLGADEQAGLKSRLDNAKTALRRQISAMQDADSSQGKLTKAWKTGRDRLYDEFRQMGLSRAEAKRLAKQYAGIPPKVKTTITQPGMTTARHQTEGLRQDIRQLPNHNALVKILTSSNYKKVKHDFDIAFPQSRAAGGPIQNVSGRGVKGKDTEPVMAAVGEHVWTSREVDAVGGHHAMYRMRAAARSGKLKGYVEGGEVSRTIRINTRASMNPALPTDTRDMAQRMGKYMGEAMSGTFQRQFNKWAKKRADDGGLGDPAHVSNPRGTTRYHGGTFTRLFVANLKAAERSVGRTYSIFQGGFRPTTSYSGSTHNMDAIDARVNYALLRAFRKHVGAMGDRTGLGHWASHMHGVPAPGHGYGSPSARAQYRDYVRRGGARQGMKSPWGLYEGGVMTRPSFVTVAEKGPERVLTTEQTRAFDRLTRSPAMQAGSGGVVTAVLDGPLQISGQLVMRDGQAYIEGIATNVLAKANRRATQLRAG